MIYLKKNHKRTVSHFQQPQLQSQTVNSEKPISTVGRAWFLVSDRLASIRLERGRESSRCSQATAGQRPADPGGEEGGCLGPALPVQRNQDRLHTCVPENQAGSRKRLLDHMSGRHHSERLFILINRQKRVPSQFLISLFLPSITESFPSSLLRRGKHKLWLTVIHLTRSINLVFSHHNGQHFLSPGHTIRSYLTTPVPRNLTDYILLLLLYYRRGPYSTKR